MGAFVAPALPLTSSTTSSSAQAFEHYWRASYTAMAAI